MSTYRELIYSVLDHLKLASDDTFFTEEYVCFMLGKFRGFLLKQRYADVRKDIPDSNYQTICLDLKEVPAIPDEECEGGVYLRSVEKIPYTMKIGSPKVYPSDYFQGWNITLVSMQRMRYVGYNRWLKNIIYTALGPDGYLYFKSGNPQYLYMEKARITGIFEDPEKAEEISGCSDKDNQCDIWDREFPLEEALIEPLVELTVKWLSGSIYKPEDTTNNATDDLSDIMTFIRRNMKNGFQKQLEE